MRLSCVSVCADSMMPKRKNPFGAITPLQRKMHVGFEQMATQQEREEVYEKTRALLFQGANPHVDAGRAPGVALPTLLHGDHSLQVASEPSCTSQQGRLFALNGQLSELQQPNGVSSGGGAGNGSSGACGEVSINQECLIGAEGRVCSTAPIHQPRLFSYFTPSQNTTGARRERTQLQGRGDRRGEGGGRGRQECCGCRQYAVDMWRCDHCEKSVCGDCCRRCCKCHSLFCSFCSVLNYDEAMLRSFCLNCLPICS